ncbi:MAG TPA: tRNA threonylcarbamoyladenosine dehydratase [Bacillota bacterium]|jgi:tRNA A37 threonylcarbamoyladenosine dehydratase|nr:tRNA threonylcarbamoyladenosine dehydratase [Bacillota bacterium]
MSEQFVRTELLIGKERLERLARARVAVFGAGGVGGFAIEALARGGVGALDIFDHDTICLSNLNRQIIATHKTIGQYKVDVAKERILEINPDAVVNAYRLFYSKDTAHEVDLSLYDYVVDAIDTVSAKIELVVQAKAAGVPVISSMGAGNKMDPTKFLVDDIYNTSVCPLAKVMRKELRQRGVDSLKVVYSKEPPVKLRKDVVMTEKTAKRHVPGSNSFVPPAAGLIIAGEVIRDLIGF